MAATSNNRVRFDAPSSAFIQSNPPYHDWIRFKFKTLPPKLAYKWRTEIEQKDSLDGEEAFNAMCELLASRLTSWSEDRPHTVEELQATPWHLVMRMANIVMDRSRGDTDPETQTKTESTEDFLGKSLQPTG